MTPPYPVVPQIVDMAAPGANTDVLGEDFELPHEGVNDVKITVVLATPGKVNLIMKPGAVLSGQKAAGEIQAIAASLLADADYFTLKDGTNTKLFEFERVRKATGLITTPAAAALVDEDEFTLDDGVNDPVVFEFDHFVEGSPATGSITTPAGSALIDDEEFVLDDGVLPPVTFIFDDDASVVEDATTRAIAFTGSETAADMKALIVTAINAATLGITAAPGAGGIVLLTNDENLADGNVAITDTVVSAGFTHIGMAGGVDDIGTEGSSGDVTITLEGTETAAEVGALITEAINGADDLDIVATDNEDGTVSLENELAGIVGNAAIVEDVDDAGFLVAGMEDGLGTVGVTAGRVAVTIDPEATAEVVAAAIVEAVNGVGSGLTLTAAVNEDDATIVDLENDEFGSFGNIANSENVTDPGFTISGMTGGYGGDVTVEMDINGDDDLAADTVYQKDITLESGYLYNLQLTVDGIIRALAVSARH